MSEDTRHLCPVSCPDCNGVLSIEESTEGYLFFRCQIGHRYSIRSVIQAKEDQLEHTLRSATVQSKQLQDLYETCMQGPDLLDRDREGLRRRLAELTEQERSILAILEGSHAAD